MAIKLWSLFHWSNRCLMSADAAEEGRHIEHVKNIKLMELCDVNHLVHCQDSKTCLVNYIYSSEKQA